MKEIVFDLEGNGLKPTKIYCLVYKEDDNIHVLTDYGDMRNLFERKDVVFVGHYITIFDIPVLEKLLGIDLYDINYIDTIGISWYLNPHLKKHGLEHWGEVFGVPKPEIEDWHTLSLEEYIHRCVEDVKINSKLWEEQKKNLLEIYENSSDITRLINYLNFKLYCLRLAEESRWKIDLEKVKKNVDILSKMMYDKVQELKKIMPPVPVYAKREMPKTYYKKDGSLSSYGQNWERLKKEYPVEKDGSIKEITKYEEPNPLSHDQIKKWLKDLGWEPCTFKTNKKGKEVPQITVIGGPELTPSVLDLTEDHEELKALEGLFTIQHRLGILEGFLEKNEDEYVIAKASGLTNTLRLKHSGELVNLPGVGAAYGEYVRPCLIAPEGHELCGADMIALEDRTKQHYIYKYDPEYVNEMNTPGFDPHLDIALQGNLMTEEEVLEYKEDPDHPAPHLKKKRQGAKTTNYCCTYGAFPPKIAKTANIPLEEAKQLFDTYWKRNWAIKKVADEAYVKEVRDQKWLFNPVSRLYYSLRHEKDRFSTLNQGTGSFCFDKWIYYVVSKRPELTAQYHDEGVWTIKKGHRKDMEDLLTEAIDQTNKELNLNVPLGINIQFGDNYGQIH